MARLEMTYTTIDPHVEMIVHETHLIDIHVTLSSRTGLEYDKREVVDQFSGYHLACHVRRAITLHSDTSAHHLLHLEWLFRS